MADKNYEAMSIEELEDEIHSLGDRRAAIAELQRAAHRVLNEKLCAQAVARKLESMSDAEKAALWQQLNAESIQSQEEVGTPGS
ncbi:MAG: hypothetical protein AB1631_24470 [Acidobacteriota bacterium]